LVGYEGLMEKFCGIYTPVLEALLNDPSVPAEVIDDLINHIDAKRILSMVKKLKPAKVIYFEDEKPAIDIDKAIDSYINGEQAIVIFAAGEASRLSKSLKDAGIITEKEAQGPEYKMWNLDLWDVAKKYNQKNISSETARELGIPTQYKIPSDIRHVK